jgi:hypothetical protein
MCTLIYATVPSRSDLGRIHGSPLRLVPADGVTVAPRLHPNEELCTVKGVPLCGGGGHCGTVLGREVQHGQDANEREARKQTSKLRKRGWSEHKIQGWLEQKQQARGSQPPNMNGEVDELALWNALLCAALDEAHLSFVGLMVVYAGDEPQAPIRCETASRSSCDLTKLEMGVLYRIARSEGAVDLKV